MIAISARNQSPPTSNIAWSRRIGIFCTRRLRQERAAFESRASSSVSGRTKLPGGATNFSIGHTFYRVIATSARTPKDIAVARAKLRLPARLCSPVTWTPIWRRHTMRLTVVEECVTNFPFASSYAERRCRLAGCFHRHFPALLAFRFHRATDGSKHQHRARDCSLRSAMVFLVPCGNQPAAEVPLAPAAVSSLSGRSPEFGPRIFANEHKLICIVRVHSRLMLLRGTI
jgi:hypothetical protein